MNFSKQHLLRGTIGAFVLTWLFCGCTLYYVRQRTYHIGLVNLVRITGQLEKYAILEAKSYYGGLEEEIIDLEEICKEIENPHDKRIKILEAKKQRYERLFIYRRQQIQNLQGHLLNKELGRLKKEKKIDFFISPISENAIKRKAYNYTDELYNRILIEMKRNKQEEES